MYQWNGKHRYKTNLILVSFFLSRSSSKPRQKPSQSVRPEKQKCAICGQYVKSGEQLKFRISEEPRAENLQKASSYFDSNLGYWAKHRHEYF